MSILTRLEMCEIVASLLVWFERRHRDIPWRNGRDPYLVWVAEIMAQQTRIATMRPYYERFVSRWPDVKSLAAADTEDVLKAWEGLGYYSRAHNLHRAAREVVARHGGRVPDQVSELRDLSGIGPYTAGAIASIAFGRAEPAVDGNARRVLSRLFDEASPTPRTLDRLARSLIDCRPDRAGTLNQAIMDLGGGVCTPRRPRCENCPCESVCVARDRGTVSERPPRTRKPQRPHREVVVGVAVHGLHVLMRRRPDEGLLGGLWEFPYFDVSDGGPRRAALAKELGVSLGLSVRSVSSLATIDHEFTHFRLTSYAYRVDITDESGKATLPPEAEWVDAERLDELALSAGNRRIANALLSSDSLKVPA